MEPVALGTLLPALSLHGACRVVQLMGCPRSGCYLEMGPWGP